MNWTASAAAVAVCPRLDHAGEVVQRRIDVGTADGFDEGGDDVVVLVAVAVVAHHRTVYGVPDDIKSHFLLPGIALPLAGRSPLGRRLEVGQRTAGIASGEQDELLACVAAERYFAAQSTFIGDRPVEHHPNIVVAEGLEFEQEGTGQQRGDHAERRVLRRRRDKQHRAVFHRGEQRVLLSLGKAVHLVDEQNGALAADKVLLRCLEHLAHLLDSRGQRGQTDEILPHGTCDERGDRRLAGARRAIENHRSFPGSLDQPAQRPPRPEQVLLPHQFVQGARAHPRGERRCGPRIKEGCSTRCGGSPARTGLARTACAARTCRIREQSALRHTSHSTTRRAKFATTTYVGSVPVSA